MSDTIQSVKDLPEVSFIDNDTLEAMKTRMVANFESEWKRITGQEITLSPSDPKEDGEVKGSKPWILSQTHRSHAVVHGMVYLHGHIRLLPEQDKTLYPCGPA